MMAMVMEVVPKLVKVVVAEVRWWGGGGGVVVPRWGKCRSEIHLGCSKRGFFSQYFPFHPPVVLAFQRFGFSMYRLLALEDTMDLFKIDRPKFYCNQPCKIAPREF